MSYALQLARQPPVLERVREMEKAGEEFLEWIPWRMAKLRADRRHVFAESFRIVLEEHEVVVVLRRAPAFAFAERHEHIHAHYDIAAVWEMANAFDKACGGAGALDLFDWQMENSSWTYACPQAGAGGCEAALLVAPT